MTNQTETPADRDRPAPDGPDMPENIWLHGLFMLILLVLVNLAQTVLGICAVFQFFWMLFAKERNRSITQFGKGVANWLSMTARFLSGGADEKPFPWTSWS